MIPIYDPAEICYCKDTFRMYINTHRSQIPSFTLLGIKILEICVIIIYDDTVTCNFKIILGF